MRYEWMRGDWMGLEASTAWPVSVTNPILHFSVCSVAWRYGILATLLVCQVTMMYNCIERKRSFKFIYNLLNVVPYCVYICGERLRYDYDSINYSISSNFPR